MANRQREAAALDLITPMPEKDREHFRQANKDMRDQGKSFEEVQPQGDPRFYANIARAQYLAESNEDFTALLPVRDVVFEIAELKAREKKAGTTILSAIGITVFFCFMFALVNLNAFTSSTFDSSVVWFWIILFVVIFLAAYIPNQWSAHKARRAWHELSQRAGLPI